MSETSHPQIKIVELKFDEGKLEELFKIKADKLRDLNIKLDVETKLKLYGLYKVATVGKYDEKNKVTGGFFDFEVKYKNQSWEKCSSLSKQDAMIEYIRIYNNLTGEQDELPIQQSEHKDFAFNIDIPEDYEGSNFYSSNAKQSKKEIESYLSTASEGEKHFHVLKEKIYSGDNITEDYLKVFSDKHGINFTTFTDSAGQTLLHISVDAMNYSAVQSLINLGIAKELVNYPDAYLMTPLHIAGINFDVEIFNLLTVLSGDYTLKDKENKTPLEYLKENEDIDKEILNQIESIQIN